jgi:predicted ATPase
MGYTVFPEIARELIAAGQMPPGHPGNSQPMRFFETVLSERIRHHQACQNERIAFYDRGIPDSQAYFNYRKQLPPATLTEAILRYRYYPVVFAASPWKAIFRQDEIRKETFQEAAVLFEFAVNAYLEAGYAVEVLPEAPVRERLAFLLSKLGEPIGQQNDK